MNMSIDCVLYKSNNPKTLEWFRVSMSRCTGMDSHGHTAGSLQALDNNKPGKEIQSFAIATQASGNSRSAS